MPVLEGPTLLPCEQGNFRGEFTKRQTETVPWMSPKLMPFKINNLRESDKGDSRQEWYPKCSAETPIIRESHYTLYRFCFRLHPAIHLISVSPLRAPFSGHPLPNWFGVFRKVNKSKISRLHESVHNMLAMIRP